MRYYSIADILAFFRYQKIFNYKGIDIIVSIMDDESKSEKERIDEIFYLLHESRLDEFITMHEMVDIEIQDGTDNDFYKYVEQFDKDEFEILRYIEEYTLDMNMRFFVYQN